MLFLASVGGTASGYSHFIQLTRLDGYWRLSRRFGEKKSLHIMWGVTYFIISFLTLRRLMSHIYGAPILDVSRSHTTTQHSR